MGIEQRRHVRYPANLPIRVVEVGGTDATQEHGRMLDVSEGGLCFVGQRYLAPGTSVQIQFEDCRLAGQVRHCRMREYSSRLQFVTGVEIQDILQGESAWRELLQPVS
jgi:hypothetical protein